MIRQLNNSISSWLVEEADGYLELIDPLDGIEISAHYGATHAAAAWIIYGKKQKTMNSMTRE